MVAHPHEIAVRGPAFLGSAEGPALLQRSDPDFVGALLAELATAEGRQRLRTQARPSRRVYHPLEGREVLRLYQPVHRMFHLVVVDVSCLVPGNPRVDPRRIESAGFVLRRVDLVPEPRHPADRGESPDLPSRERRMGWLRSETGPAGWQAISESALQAEPEADRRRVQAHPLLVAVRGRPSPLSEQVTRLFLAPPAVCEAAGRTLLYGVIPTASSEVSAPPERLDFEPDEVAQLVPAWLKSFESGRPRLPYPGRTLEAYHARLRSPELDLWLEFLRQLMVVFDALSGTDRVHQRFRQALDEVALSFPGGARRSTVAWLQAAASILIEGEAGSVVMPLEWPTISQELANRFEALCLEAVQARLAVVAPGEPRFGTADARYELHAFARVRCEANCPPKLFWAPPSERFTIAQWFENGPLPPVMVPLPDILSPDQIKQLKPNVAFQVPRDLFAFLRKNTPEDILTGVAKKANGGGLGMICGFNIPIITLCAFIMLYIVLNLLNIVFRWLPYVVICLPFPKKR